MRGDLQHPVGALQLSSFVDPAVWACLRLHWEARQAVRVRPTADQTPPLLLTWTETQLKAVLKLTALFSPGSFRVISEGRPVRPAAYRDRSGWVRWEAIEQLRAARASLNLTHVEDCSNSILAFARALEGELQCPVQINVYTTPGVAQGLGAHTDPHDVLVYQLHGRKTWNVAGGGGGTSTDDLTLEPGDWLFVPRGTRHEVRNVERESTSHLAIGLHPLTWGDFWEIAMKNARSSGPALTGSVDALATRTVAAQKLATDLLPVLSAADPAAARRDHHNSFRNFAAAVPLEHIVGPETLEHILPDTSLAWRQPDATLRSSTEFFEVDLPYRRAPLRLRPDLEAPVRFMSSAGQFRPSDLPGIDATMSLLLCRLLADIGALRVSS